MMAPDTTTLQTIYSYLQQAQTLIRVLSRGGNNTAAKWLADELGTIELDLQIAQQGKREGALEAVLERVAQALIKADTIELDLADTPGATPVKKHIGRPKKAGSATPTPIRQVALVTPRPESGLLKEKANHLDLVDLDAGDRWRLI